MNVILWFLTFMPGLPSVPHKHICISYVMAKLQGTIPKYRQCQTLTIIQQTLALNFLLFIKQTQQASLKDVERGLQIYTVCDYSKGSGSFQYQYAFSSWWLSVHCLCVLGVWSVYGWESFGGMILVTKLAWGPFLTVKYKT